MKNYGPIRFFYFIRVGVRPARFFLLVLCLATLTVHAQDPLNKKLSVELQNELLKPALDKITKASGVNFTYTDDVAKSTLRISIRAKDKSLKWILNELLSGYPYSFAALGSEVLIRLELSGRKKAGVTADGAGILTAKYALSGIVTDAGTGETLIGGTIRVAELSRTIITNEYGFYSLALPRGTYTLVITAMGYRSRTAILAIKADTAQNFALDAYPRALEEIAINANRSQLLNGTQMGLEKINVSQTNDIPVLLGERDIVKTIQLLPGIKAAGEGSSGFYVRGGASDQNLVLLDEAPVYNASHLLGFFSTFNSDAIKNASIYKGSMPAQYGGRLSSVLDIKMNDGNNQRPAISGGIGLIASRLNVEAPIQKGKSSFLLSARRTYVDAFLKMVPDTATGDAKLYFYDVNAKANYQLGARDRLYVSGYFGKDLLGVEKIGGINWGNTTGTFRWNHIFGNRVFSNSSFIYSNYNYKINVGLGINEFIIFSQIRDWNFKEDVQWTPGAGNKLSFGVNSIYHTIKPGEISTKGNSGVLSEKLQNQYSLENAAYLSDTWDASDRLSLTFGLRASGFTILGKGDFYDVDAQGKITNITRYRKGEVVKTYYNLEPRAAAGLKLNATSSLKASYVRNVQNLHLISNSTSASPTDKWVASTNLVKPETADQLSLGYYREPEAGRYEFTVETYYKKMTNQIDYRGGADIFTNEPIETQLLYGKGRAYGVELLAKKKSGRLTGWVSYTLSKTERKINGINNDQWYNARQDRTHDIVVVAAYRASGKWTLSANWVFYTGDAVTFPAGKYSIDDQTVYYYTERNGYRMPAYQRLDLGATRQLKKSEKFSSEMVLGLYNAYGYNNAYRITFRDSKTNPNHTEALRTTLFKYVPSITYNFKF
ncbi:TonB-dependent receptor [Hufsiella ginkgonis]|uniref:TonB-dependent receptor n=1 Tax=Hufsiella ginkgonis TaxID=2695274 RepID=A0A7K1XXB0_9SPHI|nr:carboxypeptidase-like regulatory domain-containing protein [Hufsiella ginkgonis]MXV15645.1 TonB-dependent receptor [Hufsiella ginkgonis]